MGNWVSIHEEFGADHPLARFRSGLSRLNGSVVCMSDTEWPCLNYNSAAYLAHLIQAGAHISFVDLLRSFLVLKGGTWLPRLIQFRCLIQPTIMPRKYDILELR